jgi:thiol-disulfide isomerase/thioredoxin
MHARAALPMLMISLLAAPGRAEEADADLPQEGGEAPSFALPVYNAEAAQATRAGTMMIVGEDAEDKEVRLVVVTFMASYCAPCKAELPMLQQLYERFKDKGLRIIGVAIDTEPAGQKSIAELLKEKKVTFPVVRDQFNLVARNYLGTHVPLPSVFLLDPMGKITFMSRGYSEEISKKLVATVERGLRAAPKAAAVGPKEARP